jgi:acetoacetyl-CoA synthetase
MQALGSTGSPLSPEQFSWIATAVGEHVQICLDVRRHGRLHGVPRQRTDGARVAGGAVLRGAGADVHAVDEKGCDVPLSDDRSTWASW